ncbi:DnaJ domain-containing protein [Actinotalea sp. M2MS4P-6]|uniref:J domain-containing protein n=1 Tax=Actinotalea sp. M2MS4P-6 TaxID=2983762 RepID=UPI0021E495EC|nr:DnaJ domain-containing protein [Actinotalea sp. M2MS4P-6]MCV2396506.1 DnaJ domain-containing protein [Actinotalea sp. M2MS4P-6]
MLPDTSYTHYEVLDVPPDASAEELRTAYRRALRRAHPDRDGHPVLFRMVQAAWQVLSDPGSRARYDAELAAGRTSAGSGARGASAHSPAGSSWGPGTRPGPSGAAGSQPGDAGAPRHAGPPPRTERREAPAPHVWLADHPHARSGLPFGRVADAPDPARLRPGAWVVTGHGTSRSVGYVRRTDGVHVELDLPPAPLDGTTLLAAPFDGPESIPLLHGHVASDGRLATVPLEGITTVQTPDPGQRAVVATQASWIPGTVSDVLDMPSGTLVWAVRLWTWDLGRPGRHRAD